MSAENSDAKANAESSSTPANAITTVPANRGLMNHGIRVFKPIPPVCMILFLRNRDIFSQTRGTAPVAERRRELSLIHI